MGQEEAARELARERERIWQENFRREGESQTKRNEEARKFANEEWERWSKPISPGFSYHSNTEYPAGCGLVILALFGFYVVWTTFLAILGRSWLWIPIGLGVISILLYSAWRLRIRNWVSRFVGTLFLLLAFGLAGLMIWWGEQPPPLPPKPKAPHPRDHRLASGAKTIKKIHWGSGKGPSLWATDPWPAAGSDGPSFLRHGVPLA